MTDSRTNVSDSPGQRRTGRLPFGARQRAVSTASCLTHDAPGREKVFPVCHYDLDATLTSGQAFRWQKNGEGWVGIVGRRWVRLRADADSITAEAAEPVSNWSWLIDYLQLELELDEILTSFPDDEPMRAAVETCRGLR